MIKAVGEMGKGAQFSNLVVVLSRMKEEVLDGGRTMCKATHGEPGELLRAALLCAGGEDLWPGSVAC